MMKVSELIEQLECCSPTAEVVVKNYDLCLVDEVSEVLEEDEDTVTLLTV